MGEGERLRGGHGALDLVGQAHAVDPEAELGAGARLLAKAHVTELAHAAESPLEIGGRANA